MPVEDEQSEVVDANQGQPRAFSLPTREPGDTGELDLNRLTDWLRSGTEGADQELEEEGTERSDSDQSAEGPLVQEIVGDWLSQDLADEPSADESSVDDEEPSWLSGIQKQPESVQAPDANDSSAWWEELRGSTQDEPAAVNKEDVASWLSELDAGDDGISDIEPVPDWLNELAAEEPIAAGAGETGPSADLPSSDELPDWLAELQPEAGATDSGQQAAESDSLPISEDNEQAVSDALPDWLGGDESEEPAETVPADEFSGQKATDDASEDIPEWLREDAEDSADEPDTAPGEEAFAGWPDEVLAEDETDTLPDWLAELGQEETAFAAAVSRQDDLIDEANEIGDREAVDEAAFEWQDQIEETVEPPDSDLPEWLREEVAHAGDSEQRLPDWLEEGDEAGDLADAEMPAWLLDEVRDTGGLDSSALSDWLSELGAEVTQPETQADRDETLVSEAGPDWARPDEELDEDEESLEPPQDDLADLLREMAPRGTGVLTPLEEEVEDDELAAELDELGIPATGPLSEIPDWLVELAEGDETPADSSISDDESEIEESSVTGLAAIAAGRTDESDLGIFEPESDFPQSTGGTGELHEDEVPEWLAALAEQDQWPQLADEVTVVESGGEIEAELQLPETEPLESELTSTEMTGVPQELAKPGLPDWMEEESDEPEQQEEVAEEVAPLIAGELPEWLQELDADEVETELTPVDAGQALEATAWGQPGAEWEDTLATLPEPDQEAGETEPISEGLAAAEIPPWLLALRPGDIDTQAEQEAADEPVETEGPLSGLQGVIQAGPLVTEPRLANEPRHHMVTKEHRQQVALLTQITHAEARPATQVTRPKMGPMSTTARSLLGVLLLVVVVLSLLLPALGIELPLMARPSLPGAARDAFDQINSVAGETVLVSFEYSPAMAGELDPIAVLLLSQLADNGSPIVAMSQYAAGVALADRAISQVENLESQSLGYVPGEAVGLRRVANCLSVLADCETMYGQTLLPETQAALADVQLAIVLTAERDSLINWIEQVQVPAEIPLVAGVTQAIGPLLAPYLSAERLQGAVEGNSAAAAYERELLNEEGIATEQQAALVIVQWVVIILLVGGSLYYGLSARAGRPAKGAGA